MKKIFFVVIMSCLSSVYSQNTNNADIQFDTSRDSTFHAEYNILKQMYVERIHKPSYIKYKVAISNYKEKWRHLYDGDGNFGQDLGGLVWLKNNWQKTEFKSYEEAVEEFHTVRQLLEADNKENREMLDFMVQFMIKYGPEPYIEITKELAMEYPDKF